MRVCIVALDALEYTIVDQGDYVNLKQAEYGRAEVDVYLLSTPMVWASFITGKEPEEQGVVGPHRWDKPWAQWLMKTSIKVSKKLHLPNIKGKGKVLEKLDLAHRRMYNREDFKNRGVPTIFDYVEKKVTIGVPSYDEWGFPGILDAIGNPIKEKRLAEKAWLKFYRTKEKVLELLDSDWELFMVHFHIVDTIQHIWWHKEDYIAGLYEEMDKTVKEIKTKLPKNTFMLIVSDHGLLKGDHTPYAFYSCNEPLNLKNPKITDFAEIILQKLGVPSKKEVEEIKERLRSLGY